MKAWLRLSTIKLLLCFPFLAVAQTKEPEDTLEQAFTEWMSEAPELNLFGGAPSGSSKSLRPYLPETINALNGDVPGGSDAIATVCYLAMSTQLRASGKSQTDLSYSYVFNHLPVSKSCTRFTLSDLLQMRSFLKNTGTIDYHKYPQKIICGNSETNKPNIPHVRISQVFNYIYADCGNLDAQKCTYNRNVKVRQGILRQAISGRHAVVALLKVEEGFETFRGQYIDYRRTEGKLHSKTIIIFGYDEEKQVFEMAFPGGKNWGVDGTAYLRYADVDKIKLAFGFSLSVPDSLDTRLSMENHVLADNKKRGHTPVKDKPTPHKPITTAKQKNNTSNLNTAKEQVKKTPPAVTLNQKHQVKITSSEPSEKVFETQKTLNASIQLNDVSYNNYNELIRTPLTLEYMGMVVQSRSKGLYQLQVSNVPAGSYVYILNIMPDSKKIHFPAGTGSKTLGVQKVSPYVTANNTEFYIPQPRIDAQSGAIVHRGFAMDSPHEYMVVLVSTEELGHKLQTILTNFNYHADHEQFKQEVDKALQKHNPAFSLDSEKQSANFKLANTDILPIIISLTDN